LSLEIPGALRETELLYRYLLKLREGILSCPPAGRTTATNWMEPDVRHSGRQTTTNFTDRENKLLGLLSAKEIHQSTALHLDVLMAGAEVPKSYSYRLKANNMDRRGDV
jgi:hypothetical protein